MTRRWTPQTCYTLRRNTASIIKDLILIDLIDSALQIKICILQVFQKDAYILEIHVFACRALEIGSFRNRNLILFLQLCAGRKSDIAVSLN